MDMFQVRRIRTRRNVFPVMGLFLPYSCAANSKATKERLDES